MGRLSTRYGDSKYWLVIILTFLGRETFLVPLEWKDDWPVINGGQKISLNSHGPGLYEFNTPVSWRDEFSDTKLQVGWYRKSEPQRLNLPEPI